ncbi:DHA2 family efflux MFS transporter permease subunit [Actinacidiphila yeochonensis]|uniref:DHA2 family efflux MFS transporter permease subunit n=1 Tax=Actinacidiphila yeochonensis TaxID=89050 RepID=UPI00099C75D2|nr:DHA2 family efflux MFS transporter permease subunit [Actinacidiphila yeochonensis]
MTPTTSSPSKPAKPAKATAAGTGGGSGGGGTSAEAAPTRTTAVWTLVVTSVAGFMAALDNLVVTTALPSIRRSLGGSMSDLEWTVNAYTLTFAVLLMFGAALGDRFGRRRLFLGGLALFTAASAAAAMAPGMGELIAARAAQGVGGAVMLPLTLTLLTAAVPAERRALAFGIWGAIQGTAIACGPLIGGTLTQHVSWHWIFWLNVPVGLVLLPLARLRLRESYASGARLDAVGTGLVSLGLFGMVFALVSANSHGWGSGRVLAGLIVGAVLMACFVLHGSVSPRAMLPMRMFGNRGFTVVNASALLMSVGMFGSVFLLSQFLQSVLGYGPQEAGLRMLPWTGMPMLVSPLTGLLCRWIGSRRVVAAGLFLQAVGLGWFASVVSADLTFTTMLPALMLCGTGMALFFAPVAGLLMDSVTPAEQGIASGTSNALREVGGTLGVALLGTVFSSNGGYGSPAAWVDGLRPALWVGGLLLAVATLAMLLYPRIARPADPAAEPAEAEA